MIDACLDGGIPVDSSLWIKSTGFASRTSISHGMVERDGVDYGVG